MREEQRRALDRGLAEFDRTVARRSRRRKLAGVVGAVALIALVGVTAQLAAKQFRPRHDGDAPTLVARRALPAYVELIRDDGQLTAELELASACERIGRSAGRMYVVECVHGDGARPR